MDKLSQISKFWRMASELDQLLYPEINPYDSGMLQVSNIHRLYYEQSGNPEGLSILCLHDGPGLGADKRDRRLFNPQKYRIIIFDQRGCGRSQPLGETHENDLAELVKDIERLRRHLNVDRWNVYGHGWGATVGVHYVTHNVGRVHSLIVSGFSTCEPATLEWFFGNGYENFLPDEFVELKRQLEQIGGNPEDIRHSIEHLMLNGTLKQQKVAANAFNRWRQTCMRVFDGTAYHAPEVASEIAREITTMRIYMHFIRNGMFLKDAQIINEARKLEKTKGAIIHGRFDLLHPLRMAYQLQRRWKRAPLDVVHQAAHSREAPYMEKIMLYLEHFTDPEATFDNLGANLDD